MQYVFFLRYITITKTDQKISHTYINNNIKYTDLGIYKLHLKLIGRVC